MALETFQLRQASLADSVLLADLGARTFADTFSADNTPEDMAAYLSAHFNPGLLELELRESSNRFFIAEHRTETVGYAWLRFGHAPEAVAAVTPVEIVRFYAAQGWIGKGVGAFLMKACLRQAEDTGCDVAWLGVWERNPRAVAFYRKWGFEPVGKQTFQLGNDLQTDHIMARSLRS